MAGNGTIGLELVEDLDDFDAVLIPWGGGGLTTGIASALQALRPRDEGLRLRAGDGRAGRRRPFANGARAGQGRVPPSFIDGAGSGALLPKMWEHARDARHRCVRRSRSRTRRPACDCCSSARVSSARAQPGSPSRRRWPGSPVTGRVVCIVSGGNIDSASASRRSSKAASRTSRRASARARRRPRARGSHGPTSGRIATSIEPRTSASTRARRRCSSSTGPYSATNRSRPAGARSDQTSMQVDRTDPRDRRRPSR